MYKPSRPKPKRWVLPEAKRLYRLPDETVVVLGDEHYLVRPRLQDQTTGDLLCELLAEAGDEEWRLSGVVTVPPTFLERTIRQRVRAYLA